MICGIFMHPLFKSVKRLIVVGIIWTSLILGLAALYSRLAIVSLSDSIIFIAPLMIIEVFLALSTWYICKNIKLEIKNVITIIIKHGLSAVILIVLWLIICLIFSGFLDQQMGNDNWRVRFDQLVPFLCILGIFFYTFFCMIHYLILSMEKTRIAEKELITSRLVASKAELKALRSTIHPHFLFNSLNAIGVLTRTAPEKAQKVSIKLSDFLRYSLKYDNHDLVTVDSEIDHIKNYLSVEQIRMGERLIIKYDVDAEVSDILIPPFSLLPLVENAVKHGIQNLIEGGEIEISIKRNENFLFINVKNPYDSEHQVKEGEKHGLQNLRDRLTNRYRTEFNLKIDKTNNIFNIRIYLPLKGEEN